MKKETAAPAKHYQEAEHESIHHYGEDDTALAKGLRWLMLQGPRVWVWVGGGAIVALVAWLAVSRVSQGDPTSAEAWKSLMLSESSTDQKKIVEDFPDTKAALWVKLELAGDDCTRAFRQLPIDADQGRLALKTARDRYQEVFEATEDPYLKRAAMFGYARACEARNELEKAREKYLEVAKAWPESPEGKQSEKLAKQMKEPGTIAFYEKLYAFKPADAAFDPLKGLNLPQGHPDLNGPIVPGGPLFDINAKPGASRLPDDVFQGDADKAQPPSEPKKTKVDPVPDVFPDETKDKPKQ